MREADRLAGDRMQRKSRKDRIARKQMHADLVQVGFDGSYEAGRSLRAGPGGETGNARSRRPIRETFVPLVFEPGEAFQFDWSEDCGLSVGPASASS